MLPAWSVGQFLDAAARPVVGGLLPAYSLAVWHGLNTPFLMSLVALAAAVARFCPAVAPGRTVRRRGRLASQIPPPGGTDPAGRLRPGHLHHLPVVLGPRPRPHANRGGTRHHGAHLAGPALAAQAR